MLKSFASRFDLTVLHISLVQSKHNSAGFSGAGINANQSISCLHLLKIVSILLFILDWRQTCPARGLASTASSHIKCY